MDWKLVRGDVNGLNWNEIIKFSYLVSTLNKALLRVIRNRVPKRTIVSRREIHLGVMTRVFWLTVRSGGRIEGGVVVGCRLIGRIR